MDTQPHINNVAEKLSFQVLTGPCRNSIANELSRNTTGTPINVKIKLRNKNEKVCADVFCVSKTGRRDTAKNLRLVSSDQTITSFNLLMQSDTANESKKSTKRQNKFLHLLTPGVCLGVRNDDNDYAYMPKSSVNNDHSSEVKTHENVRKEAFGLKKNYVVNEILHDTVQRPKTFMGKCKPGGCLDPPFDEEKCVKYEPPIERSPQKPTITSPSLKNNESSKLYLRSTSLHKDSGEENCIKTDSLITYPSNLVCNEPRIRHSRDKESLDKSNKYIKEIQQDKNISSFYTPERNKERSFSSKSDDLEEYKQQYDNLVQYPNKKISSLSRDTILPTIGGPTVPVLPNSVELSTIESDTQTQYTSHKNKVHQEIPYIGDATSITTEKSNTVNIGSDFDLKTKEIKKLSYLESINKNGIYTLPDVDTKTAVSLDQNMGNKDIIVIAPIKPSTEKRHGSYSDSENINMNIRSPSAIKETSQKESIMLPTNLNKVITTPEIINMPKTEVSFTNTHSFSSSFSDEHTNGKLQNDNIIDIIQHDISKQNDTATLPSHLILTNPTNDENSINLGEFDKEKLLDNMENISIKISYALIEHDVENVTFNTLVPPEPENSKANEKIENQPSLPIPEQMTKSVSDNDEKENTETSYIKQHINTSDQSLSEPKQMFKLNKRSQSINKLNDDSSSILSKQNNRENDNITAYDTSIFPDYSKSYQADIKYSTEKLVSQTTFSDSNINIAHRTSDTLIIKDAEENKLPRISSSERGLIPKLDEEYKINSQDVKSHDKIESDENAEVRSNTQSTYNDFSNKNIFNVDSIDIISRLPGEITDINNKPLKNNDHETSPQSGQTPDGLTHKSFTDNIERIPTNFHNARYTELTKLNDKSEDVQPNKNQEPYVIQQNNVSFIDETSQNRPNSISRDISKISNDLKTAKGDTIYLDFAMNILEDANKQKIIKSYDTENTPEIEKKSRLVINSTMGIDEDGIRIPIDPATDFVLQVKKHNIEKTRGESTASRGSFNSGNKYDKDMPNIYSRIDSHKMFEDTIISIYEHHLVPVESMIKALNEDIKILVQNQKVIKQMLKANRNKTVKAFVGNRKCGCNRGLLQ